MVQEAHVEKQSFQFNGKQYIVESNNLYFALYEQDGKGGEKEIFHPMADDLGSMYQVALMAISREDDTVCIEGCGKSFWAGPGHPSMTGYKPYVDCPHCGHHYDERTVECWAQIMWPSPDEAHLFNT